MSNAVDYEEIERLYRQAPNKAEEIQILAELTASDTETIIEVLKDLGVFKPEDVAANIRTCSKCGRAYITANRKGRAVCPQCQQEHRYDYKKRKKEERRDGVSIS